MRVFICKALLSLALTAAFCLPAFAADDSAGNVIAARRQAWAERGREQNLLAGKSPVFMGDVLATNPKGRLQVLFHDDSVLMMAPDTRATVSEYVYEKEKKPVFGLNMAKGATRLISGRISEADPKAMTVETPHAVIGIRGTDLQITVTAEATEVSLLQGSGKALEIYSKVHNTRLYLDTAGTSVTVRADASQAPRTARTDASRLIAMAIPIENAPSYAPAGSVVPKARPETIVTNTVVDTSANQNVVQTPSAPSFSGVYSGSLRGTVNNAQVDGGFHVGIKDLDKTPTVNAVSLFASEKGWAAGARQALAIQGEGRIAALDADGGFNFRADETSVARLSAGALLPGGRVDATGATDGAAMTLTLLGALDGKNEDVDIAGSGAKTSASGPLPVPPAVVPSFTGTYAGTLNGTVANVRAAGAFQIGIKDLGATPAVNAVSLYANEAPAVRADAFSPGAAAKSGDSGRTLLAVHGSGNLATLNSDGSFRFRADRDGGAKMEAVGMTRDGALVVSGTAKGLALDLSLAGSRDGIAEDIALVGDGVKTANASPDKFPAPPAVAPTFSGGYQGALSGAIGSTNVSGAYYMGVKDISARPFVNAVSLFVSEKGWAENATQALSIRGEGYLAALNGDGAFQFTATSASAAKLNAHGLTSQGSVTVDGVASANSLNLSLAGTIDGTTLASASGGGGKVSETTPSLSELPAPPAIVAPAPDPDPDPVPVPPAPNFSGRYAGALSGAIGATNVSGAYHMGVKNIATTPTVNAVSLFMSEQGWAENATQALSIYGDGNLAALDGDGAFQFTATNASAATLDAHGLTNQGSVTVGGVATADSLNLSLAGTTDGTTLVSASGGGDKTSNTVPNLSELPAPPAITVPPAPNFSGRYAGALSGAIGATNVSGAYHMGVKNIATTPTVNAVSLFMSEQGWTENATQALSIHGDGNLAVLDGDGAFQFTATNASPAKLDAHGLTNQGSVTVGGVANADSLNLSLAGTTDGTTLVSASGGGDKTSNTAPNLSELPAPPAITAPPAPDFSGRYAGALSGAIGATNVSGAYHMGVKSIATIPTVNAVSLFMSEQGWAENATQALSIHGDGNLAVLDGDGAFQFTATNASPAKLDAHGVTSQGSVTVGGVADLRSINLSLAGSVDGTTLVSASGGGDKTSNTAPSLSELPAPPAITSGSNFQGYYAGAVSGQLDPSGAALAISGDFNMTIADVANVPNITDVRIQAHQPPGGIGLGVLAYGSGAVAPLDSSGNFSFIAGSENQPAYLATGGEFGDSITVQGGISGAAANISWNGTSDGYATTGSGSGARTTAP